jgi:hypothetical protein
VKGIDVWAKIWRVMDALGGRLRTSTATATGGMTTSLARRRIAAPTAESSHQVVTGQPLMLECLHPPSASHQVVLSRDWATFEALSRSQS